MKIYEGRPDNFYDRLLKEQKCYEFLDKLKISYYRVDHKPADDMQACIEIEKYIGVGICKNLFLCNSQATKFYLLMMKGEKKFQTSKVSKQINSSRLSFANEENLLKYLDVTRGSVSILALLNDFENKVQLLIDKDILKQKYIRCHPCINTSTLKIKTDDFLEKVLPSLAHKAIYIEV